MLWILEPHTLKEHIVKTSKLFYGLDKMKVKTLACEYAKKRTKEFLIHGIQNKWQEKIG